MHAKYWRHFRLTAGERSLALAYVTVSLFGAVLAFCAVMRLAHGEVMARPLSSYEIWICISGAIGAGSGLFLTQHRLGQPGSAGFQQAAIGMALISFAGSLIAGTLALPLYGTMFGPFTLVVILIGSPMLGVFWLTTLFCVHLLLIQWRVERDTIFTSAVPRPRFGRIPGLTPRP